MKKWIATVLILVFASLAAGCAQSGQAQSTLPPETTPESTTAIPETSSGPELVEISFSREGNVTTLTVPMVDGTVGNYRIATNPEIFRHESSASSDVFWYTLWEGQPNIYYSISYCSDMTAEVMEDGLLHQNDGATSEKVKIGQYEAIAVYASKQDGPSTQQHFYLVPHEEGCFMIETQFVFEMYEGLFPQMRALFDTFQTLD